MYHYSKNLLIVSLFVYLITVSISASYSRAQCPPTDIIAGEEVGAGLGWSVSVAGDVNNDGYEDVIVGAPSGMLEGHFGVLGKAIVYSGINGEVLYTFVSEQAFDGFGISVSNAGDVNDDGYADVIVGAYNDGPGSSGSGHAYVFSGRTGDVLYTFGDGLDSDALGWSVSGAGDVNADGYSDLIVGAPSDSSGAYRAGRVFVYSGRTGTLMYTFTGMTEFGGLGYCVSSVGDVNDDSYDDLLVGSRANLGKAFVYSGKSGLLLYTFSGESNEAFGISVSGVGDMNKDGFADIIVGATAIGVEGAKTGRVYVFSGNSGLQLFTISGEAENNWFGISVSGTGDLDADGYPDFIVGGRQFGGSVTGGAYVYSGRGRELLLVLRGEKVWDWFGFSVSGGRDFGNSGNGDLIIGASFNDAGGNSAGRAYVYSFCNCCDMPGDYNKDGSFDLADITAGIARIFSGGPAPFCDDESDVNRDNRFNISDVVYEIVRIFSGGPTPVCGTTGM